MTRGRWGFVAWSLVAAALAISGLPHERERFLRSASGQATFAPTPARLLDEVRLRLTNDGDVHRYCAYANAALGRPYQAFYVRTQQQWLAAFAAREDEDPDARGIARPAAPLAPYRDFLVEYPPGFFAVALPPLLVSSTQDGYVTAFCALMALLLTAALVLCVRTARALGEEALAEDLPAFAAAALLAAGVVATHRYDALVAFLVCAMAWAAAARKPGLCGVALGAAVASKLTPLLAAPALLAFFALCPGAPADRPRARRALARFVLAAGLTAALLFSPVLATGAAGLADMLRYHAQRPLQIESTAAVLLALARALGLGEVGLEYTFGSFNVASPLVAPVSQGCGLLGGALGVAALVMATRRLAQARPGADRSAALVEGMLAPLLSFMAFGKVLSPQYLVWLLPLGMLAALRRSRWHAAALVAAFAITQALYPYSYDAVTRLEPWTSALLMLRNGILAGLAVAFSLPPRAGEPVPEPALAVPSLR